MKRPLFGASLFVVAFIALLRYGPWHVYGSDALPDGEDIIVTGEVCDKTSESFTIKEIKIESADGDMAENLTGRKLVCVPEDTGNADGLPAMGCVVRCQGTFCAYSHATNPGEFDYADYYDAIGVEGRLKNAKILACTAEHSRLRETLYRLRCYWKARFYSVFPEKEASVMTALLLGDREGLDEDIKLLYKRNGILHILSISGLHISLIGLGIYGLLRRVRLPGIPAAVLSSIVLVLYGIMTGMGISVRRAVGMFLIQMLARVVGRTYDMLTALGLMAAVVVAQNPACLELMAFWLSFGSVLGIGCLLPVLRPREREKEDGEKNEEEPARGERYREGWRKRVHDILVNLRDGLRDELLVGLSATCTTLPVLLLFTYELPVYAIFLNILILPFMKVLLYVGLFVMLIPGTGVAGTVDSLILAGYEGLCRWFGKLPLHTWNPGCPAVWAVIGYYLLWLAVLALCRRHRRWRYPLLAAAAGLLGLHLPSASSVTFLDVGQGDCICLRLSSGEVYLFDCGSTSRSDIGERVLIPYLKYYGIRGLTAVLVSHPDADHMNGIAELLEVCDEESLEIANLILPEIEETQRESAFADLLEIGGEWNVDYVSAGEGWTTEDGEGAVTFLCLGPERLMGGTDTNAWSECFYITAENENGERHTILLTGDVQAEGEEFLTAELKKRGIDSVGLLKVAHHGSRNSTTKTFLDQLTPDTAVISCGKNNSYRHPHTELLERLESAGTRVLRTDEDGAVTVSLK